MIAFPDFSMLEYVSKNMPLFPLGRTVLLPHTVLPLHVFEPRYVQLIRHIQNSHHMFAIPRLKDPSFFSEAEQIQDQPPIHSVAGIAKIMQVEELQNNRFNIWTFGVGTMFIEEELPINPLPIDHPDSYLYRRGKGRICLPSFDGDLQSVSSNSTEQVGISASEGKEQILLTKHLLFEVSKKCPQMQDEVSKLLEPNIEPDCMLNILAHLFIKSTSQKQIFLEEMNLGKKSVMLNDILADIVITCNEDPS